jgi:hypothetical protein
MGTQFDWKIICRKQWRIEWTTRWSLLKSGHKWTFLFADSERKSQVPIIFWQSSCCILLSSQPITWVKNWRQLHAYCKEFYVFILLILWTNWGQTIIEKRDLCLLWLTLKRSFKPANLRQCKILLLLLILKWVINVSSFLSSYCTNCSFRIPAWMKTADVGAVCNETRRTNASNMSLSRWTTRSQYAQWWGEGGGERETKQQGKRWGYDQ